jgi:hypothetical protein
MQARRARFARKHQGTSSRRLPRRTLFMGIGIVIITAVILGVGFWGVVLPRLASGAYLGPCFDGYSVTAKSKIGPGDVIYFGVQFTNESDQTITLQSISFPRGLPSHVHLVHAVVMAVADQPDNQLKSVLDGVGWPPDAEGPAVIHPIAGYHLAPHSDATIIYAVTANVVGTFSTGPLTVHALAPVIFGSSFGALPVSMTYRQYGILCMRDQSTCAQAIHSVDNP